MSVFQKYEYIININQQAKMEQYKGESHVAAATLLFSVISLRKKVPLQM